MAKPGLAALHSGCDHGDGSRRTHRRSLVEAMEKHFKVIERQVDRATPRQPAARGGDEPLRVGIVGGGMAGLYAAMLLDQLGIDFHIFEASPERLGGRVMTHYFSHQEHQYAELGAMRFPESWLQSRLFEFWHYLDETASTTPGAREIPRIPYVLFDSDERPGAGNLLCFNGQPPVTRNQAAQKNELLGFDAFFEGEEFDYFKRDGAIKPADELLCQALEPFMNWLEHDEIDVAWAKILEYNGYSARSYLQQFGDGTRPYPVAIVDYLESVLSYSGVYDLSFIELLLDNFSFSGTEHWYAMDGGTSRLTEEMVNRISPDRVTMGAKVFALDERGDRSVIHYRSGKASSSQAITAEFDRVIVTLPFPILRFLDTPDSWSAKKYESIRMLKMINATKVALGFKSRFWERPGPHSEGMRGGQSNTDLPVRSIVYPSFGLDEKGPAYLLASYCWHDDADKFTHLAPDEIYDLCLQHVVHLHGEVASREYLGHDHSASVVWNQSTFSGGGFEFFAPGQFLEKFVHARQPEGRFHFAGEHLDMAHYWIAGSFDSAFRTVWEILVLEGLMTPEVCERLREALGGGLVWPSMVPTFGSDEAEALARELASFKEDDS